MRMPSPGRAVPELPPRAEMAPATTTREPASDRGPADEQHRRAELDVSEAVERQGATLAVAGATRAALRIGARISRRCCRGLLNTRDQRYQHERVS